VFILDSSLRISLLLFPAICFSPLAKRKNGTNVEMAMVSYGDEWELSCDPPPISSLNEGS